MMAENGEVTLALLGQRMDQQDKTLEEVKGMLVEMRDRDERKHEALEGRVVNLERCESLDQQEQADINDEIGALKVSQVELRKRMDKIEMATIKVESSLSTLMKVTTWLYVTIGGGILVWVVEQLLGLIGK